MRSMRLLLLVGALGLAMPILRAGAIFYPSQSSFLSAAGTAGLSTSTIDFATVTAGTYNTVAGLTVDGSNFVGPDGGGGYMLEVGAPLFPTGTGNVLFGIEEIDVALPPDTYAFGANVGASFVYLTGVSSSVTSNLSDGSSDSVPITASSLFPFFGFVSTAPISNVDITGPSFLTTDNVITGTNAVPEPSSWWLVAGLMILLAWVRRRRRREGTTWT